LSLLVILIYLGNFNGRKAIVEEGIIHNLSILFDDQENMARKNAHKTVEMVSELVFGELSFYDHFKLYLTIYFQQVLRELYN